MTESEANRIPTDDDRRALLRSLTAWTGRVDVAEDLVQQTMLEAWRSRRQPERDIEWRPWLFGVARNVLLRWQRDRGRHGFVTPAGPEDERILELASAVDDLEALLTTSELASLVDDLLHRLPAETRDALVLRYLADLPQAEVADRLGLHEKALEGRLHRGRNALRRALITNRPDTAIDLGLVTEPGVWRELDLLCPSCGGRHLAGRWFEDGGFQVTCRECPNPGERLDILVGASSERSNRFRSRPSLNRATRNVLRSWSPFHRDGVRTEARCPHCASRVITHLEHRPDSMTPDSETNLDLVFDCDRCGRFGARHTVAGSGLIVAEGQAFWERHRAIYAKPSKRVSWHGIDAIVSTWRSFDGHALSAWYSTTTAALLAIDEDGIAVRLEDR